MMASDPKRPKFAEDFSPSVKVSDVLDVIKDLYFGTGPVNIDEKFLDELKSVLESKVHGATVISGIQRFLRF